MAEEKFTLNFCGFVDNFLIMYFGHLNMSPFFFGVMENLNGFFYGPVCFSDFLFCRFLGKEG